MVASRSRSRPETPCSRSRCGTSRSARVDRHEDTTSLLRVFVTLQLADRLQRADFAANAIAWLARCRQANGDLGAAIDMDRRAMSRAPGLATAAHMIGPLALYLAGRSREAIPLAIEAADAARASGDTTFNVYALPHVGLNMAAAGRYADASKAFHEARWSEGPEHAGAKSPSTLDRRPRARWIEVPGGGRCIEGRG